MVGVISIEAVLTEPENGVFAANARSFRPPTIDTSITPPRGPFEYGLPVRRPSLVDMTLTEHWDNRYRDVGAESVSWFQAQPTESLGLPAALDVTPSAALLDVGGGASRLVDHLLSAGYPDVTVLDLSQAALDVARSRLPGASVNWVCADVTTWEPTRTWDVWHDRAVLHFLVDEGSRVAYLRTMRRALNPGGAIVIGTFAEDGPTHCSNLEVRRFSQGELVELLGETFEPLLVQRIMHQTPGGATQPFNWIAGRERG